MRLGCDFFYDIVHDSFGDIPTPVLGESTVYPTAGKVSKEIRCRLDHFIVHDFGVFFPHKVVTAAARKHRWEELWLVLGLWLIIAL